MKIVLLPLYFMKAQTGELNLWIATLNREDSTLPTSQRRR